MTNKVIIFGNSDFAKLIYFYLKEEKKYEIVGFCVDDEFIKEKTFCGLKIIPFSQIKQYPPKEYKIIVAIGYQKINTIREAVFKRFKNLGYNFISYVHKSAVLAQDFKIKENCIILENVVIQPFCEVNENTIILPRSVICHDAKIGKNCFIASCVCVNGYTIINNNTFLGAGSVIRDKIAIGCKNLIGAGCSILNSTEDNYVCKSDKNIQILRNSEEIKI